MQLIPMLPIPEQIKWDKDKQTLFETMLQCQEAKAAYQNILSSDPSENSNSADLLSETIVNAAKAADMEVKKPKPTVLGRKTKAKKPKWHGASCHDAFVRMQKTAKLLQSQPNNAWLHGKLNTENKAYKK